MAETKCAALTLEDAKRIYLAVFPFMADQHSASEWNDIRDEVERVLAAKSDRKAAEVIRWWDCWTRELSCLRAVRRMRAEGGRRD